jgi:hypothetical protein
VDWWPPLGRAGLLFWQRRPSHEGAAAAELQSRALPDSQEILKSASPWGVGGGGVAPSLLLDFMLRATVPAGIAAELTNLVQTATDLEDRGV